MTENEVAALVQHAFPPNWRGRYVVQYDLIPPAAPAAKQQQTGAPTLEWLQLLWSYINRHVKDLSLFTTFPLVLATNHVTVAAAAPGAATDVTKYFMCRLSLSCHLLAPDKTPFAPALLMLLTKLNIFVVDMAHIPIAHDQAAK
jgi:hypothetical protein